MLNGHILHERYQIIRKIGGGGMADVYLATDIILNRDVAIKVLRMEYANDIEFIERFDREAKAATSLSHPNIVNIYDVGEEDKIFFMAMEFVDGLTLKEYIQRDGALPVEETIKIMKQLTDAIAHAHVNGLIHRDIKPQNILIDQFGNVKITDFGIAIAMSATSLTQTNSIVGSVHYLSPEQARGGVATKKSDIYSLGIVMYELLTGKLAFTGESAVAIALKHLQNEMPSVRSIHPEVPQSVENVVLKATAKDSFHRFGTVFEMEEALNVALEADRLHEAKFMPPNDEGEETKVIPVVTEAQIKANNQAPVLGNQPKDEKVPSKKKKPFFKSMWFIAIIALMVLIGGVVAFILLQKPKEAKIPDIIGWEHDEAVEELERLNFTVEEKEMYSEEYAEGEIVKTDPKVGRTINLNTPVTIFVSQGVEKAVFDDHIGENIDDVKAKLIEIGYAEEEIIIYEKTSDLPVGEILKQVQPDAGDKVIPGETTVIFEVSKGLDAISLNNLRSLTVEEATRYLDEQGLKIDIKEEHHDTIAEGLIISQSPESSTKVEVGDTIDVVVSLGKEIIPPRSHTVSFTVLFEPELLNPEVEFQEEDENGEIDEPIYETEQLVQIFVSDANEDITDVFKEELITEDREFTLTLAIAPDTTASYKVVRNGTVVKEDSIPYKEGE